MLEFFAPILTDGLGLMFRLGIGVWLHEIRSEIGLICRLYIGQWKFFEIVNDAKIYAALLVVPYRRSTGRCFMVLLNSDFS